MPWFRQRGVLFQHAQGQLPRLLQERGSVGPDAPARVQEDAPRRERRCEALGDLVCGCASGLCFLVPILGGWCGECLVDADCGNGGCTIPDPISSVGATCN